MKKLPVYCYYQAFSVVQRADNSSGGYVGFNRAIVPSPQLRNKMKLHYVNIFCKIFKNNTEIFHIVDVPNSDLHSG